MRRRQIYAQQIQEKENLINALETMAKKEREDLKELENKKDKFINEESAMGGKPIPRKLLRKKK